ncbi:MFS transporter [Ciceribacter sp. L1K22]|uniref:MFS transporter n=1 Tax=Ciceribacter sp. L1K22 TaxID=2820275 RepID=UPI001ABDD02A|nr:MFS transporter [Ciceribacter sp. L1K22]MBO3759147.1 MFS transporter [Ciceribacter sp. L1K22]
MMDQRGEQAAATAGDELRAGWAELLEPRYALTTLMLCIGVALYAFNGFLVSTVLPSAVAELDGASLISWSLSLYLAASIVAGACAALLKMRYGARATLVCAAIIFLGGTLVAGTASDMPTMLGGRLLQGFGEGLVAALCYALIPDMFPERLVPKVFGVEAGVWAAAAFGGPVAAGLLTEHVSWRMAFHVNLPIILLFLALAVLIAPKRETGAAPQPLRLPGLRLIILSFALGAVMLAAIAGTISASAALIVASALAILLLIRIDRRAGASSILPTSAFSTSGLPGLTLWIVFLMAVAQATSSVYLVFALQNLFGFSPTLAGAIGALMAICWSVSAILVAHVSGVGQQRQTLWAGPMLQVVGLICILIGISGGWLAAIIAGQIFIGSGFGISWAFISQTSMMATPAAERDKTSALLPTLQSTGFAIGGALCGFAANAGGLAEQSSGDAVRQPLTLAFLAAVAWAIPAVAAGWRAMRRSSSRS